MTTFPVNQAITYTALAQTQGTTGHSFNYSWSFDDGTTANTASTSKTWTTTGNHIATVTATDATTNGTATAQKSVSISDATWVSAAVTTRDLYVVTYGEGLFVAAADDNGAGDGGIWTSADGLSWTSRTSPVAANFNAGAYGNGTFVLVGTHSSVNYVVYSPDGITWSVPTFPNKQWQAVAYGNSTFVALSYLNGTTGQAMTSPDGITWTSRNTSVDAAWNAVCYGNGKFVAVSTGTNTMTSTDGISWTTGTAPASQAWIDVAYGNGIYVAIANVVTTGQIMYSSDGISWTQISAPDAVQLGSISFGNGVFVITPTQTGLSWGSYITPDCQTFFKISTDAVNAPWRGSIYGNGIFVSVGDTNSYTTQSLIW